MTFQLTPTALDQLALVPVPPNLTVKQVDDYLSVICGERVMWTTEGVVVYKSRAHKVVVGMMSAVAFYNEVSKATKP
jgi:hypothetical protein